MCFDCAATLGAFPLPSFLSAGILGGSTAKEKIILFSAIFAPRAKRAVNVH